MDLPASAMFSLAQFVVKNSEDLVGGFVGFSLFWLGCFIVLWLPWYHCICHTFYTIICRFECPLLLFESFFLLYNAVPCCDFSLYHFIIILQNCYLIAHTSEWSMDIIIVIIYYYYHQYLFLILMIILYYFFYFLFLLLWLFIYFIFEEY